MNGLNGNIIFDRFFIMVLPTYVSIYFLTFKHIGCVLQSDYSFHESLLPLIDSIIQGN